MPVSKTFVKSIGFPTSVRKSFLGKISSFLTNPNVKRIAPEQDKQILNSEIASIQKIMQESFAEAEKDKETEDFLEAVNEFQIGKISVLHIKNTHTKPVKLPDSFHYEHDEYLTEVSIMPEILPHMAFFLGVSANLSLSLKHKDEEARRIRPVIPEEIESQFPNPFDTSEIALNAHIDSFGADNKSEIPEYTGIFCVQNEEKAATFFQNSGDIYSKLSESARTTLKKEYFGVNFTKNTHTETIFSIFSEDGKTIRYGDTVSGAVEVNPNLKKEQKQQAQVALDELKDVINNKADKVSVVLESGDAIFFRNYKPGLANVLHMRPTFKQHKNPEQRRCLLRTDLIENKPEGISK